MREEVRVPASVDCCVRFVSIEPLLEDVAGELQIALSVLGDRYPRCEIDWLIAGGESSKPGDKPARPMRPAWARGVRDVSVACGVPFLFKQWGDWAPVTRYQISDAPGFE